MNEAFTKILNKYANFADVFLPKLAIKLSKHMGINDYDIELVDDWQLPYVPIYNLSFVELEILKTYIKNNLINDFIRPSKAPIRAPIFFNKKPDGSV